MMQNNKTWLSLCALLGLLPGAVAAEEIVPARIRVLTYNIHHGEGGDYIVDLTRVARVINSVEPDLVALQEVDSNVRRSELLDEPAELARLTNLDFVFGHNIPHQGGLYGNAVLSRWPIRRAENHPLPVCYVGEQRGVLEVEIDLPGESQPLVLYATHFDYRRRSCERLLSARFVNDLVRQRQPVLALLAGDLNDTPRSRTLGELNRHWQRASAVTMPTFPVLFPHKQIDYVLTYPRGRWRHIQSRVPAEVVASDHRPLLTVLELPVQAHLEQSLAKESLGSR